MAEATADMDTYKNTAATLHPSIVAWAKCNGVEEKDAAAFWELRKRRLFESIANEEPCEEDTPEDVEDRRICKEILQRPGVVPALPDGHPLTGLSKAYAGRCLTPAAQGVARDGVDF